LKEYKHILVATNLIEDTKPVADKAKALAKLYNAKLSLVHVISYSPVLYGAGEFAIPLNGDVETSIQKQAEETLAKEGERLGVAKQDQWIEIGTTSGGIVNLVNKIGADLLVMGSHEHHGLGFLLGSTSNALLHAMPCDVLAMRLTD